MNSGVHATPCSLILGCPGRRKLTRTFPCLSVSSQQYLGNRRRMCLSRLCSYLVPNEVGPRAVRKTFKCGIDFKAVPKHHAILALRARHDSSRDPVVEFGGRDPAIFGGVSMTKPPRFRAPQRRALSHKSTTASLLEDQRIAAEARRSFRQRLLHQRRRGGQRSRHQSCDPQGQASVKMASTACWRPS